MSTKRGTLQTKEKTEFIQSFLLSEILRDSNDGAMSSEHARQASR